MSVISILLEALRGERRSGEETKGASFAAALTSGLYEISQALGRPKEDVQLSFDLITSASASILRVERCALFFLEPDEELPQIRSMAGMVKPLEKKYRIELLYRVVKPVLSSGEGIIVSEGRPGIDRSLLRLMRRIDIQGFIVAPIKSGASVVGMVIAASPLDRRELGDEDLKLLTVMANFAAVAHGNSALVARLDKRARKLSAIFEISKALNEELSHADLLQLIIDRAVDLLGAYSGSVIRVDHLSGLLHIEAEQGLGVAVKSGLQLRIGEGITGWVAKKGMPLLVSDVRADTRYVEANPFVGCEMAVPIKWGSEVMGVINLDHDKVDGFMEEDLDMLEAFGHVAGAALRNSNVLRDWTLQGE
ncbi:MAG: GAF domain-containing protein [Syntrophorhabdaceae bacterium]|nr:GAF domain-containing protein [Syntrophorhabdaceae bacterium]